jgi:hypothetical protein
MPVQTASGRWISTDQHRAILVKAGASLQETLHLPAIRSNPISPMPAMGPTWQAAAVQHLGYEHLDRTFFGTPEKYGAINDLSLRSWLTFLEQAQVSTEGYSESKRVPGLMRCHTTNEQIKCGKLQLFTDGARYLIAPASKAAHAPMCTDLAAQGAWSVDLCCPICHSEKSFMEFPLAGSDPLAGKQGKRWVLGCCRAEQLMPDYHPGQVYSSEQLRTHDYSGTIECV